MLKNISEINNKFCFNLYFELLDNNKEKNIFYSPYSLLNVLLVVYEGSKGNTANQILKVLYLPKDTQNIKIESKELYKYFNKNQESYILKVVNALWIQKNYPILKNYIENAKIYYNSEVKNLDFYKSEEARNEINNYIYKHTEEKIKDFLPKGSINYLTRIVITNAIYFKGTWIYEFDKSLTAKDMFYVKKGKTVEISMMHKQKVKLNYLKINELEIIELPYKGNNLSMIIILPNENIDINELLQKLSYKDIINFINKLKQEELDEVIIPKFKLETSYDLKEYLLKMGVKDAFNESLANFSGITKKEKLYITGVFHKAFIEVNEEGTEAAAATGAILGTTSIKENQKIFKANRPFLFLIKAKDSNLILFIGKISNPTEN